MTDASHRPLLFLDIDGPLIPFGLAPESDASPPPVTAQPALSNPLAQRVDPALGPLLAALPCELLWAATWMDEANRSIGPLLGLPTLEVVAWPDESNDRVDEWFGLHWKTRTLVEFAAGRPFLWIDDEIGDSDREWVSREHPGRALLHRVDPCIGLRPNDFAAFIEWFGPTPEIVVVR
ncbi:hypothetical protein OHB26_14495 [Nocardia sp. NBC_01503]|uniref:hypothetical protein n=1 Tax=Nocardia sp. NBC_01503 TaxID=2975997 RepID=UPI002E7AD8BB|nr:hypothetical protein [Nocardia sp. NBC_01503]WTL35293.1 hypothetical protein OHB26_14495 [Nocardia sp. NBC_01503]